MHSGCIWPRPPSVHCSPFLPAARCANLPVAALRKPDVSFIVAMNESAAAPDLPLVLILCTGNSCRSQMAEAFLQAAAKGRFLVASAGSKPAGFVHPLAIKVMREVGFDISKNRSKHLSEFLDRPVETVITVCGKGDS